MPPSMPSLSAPWRRQPRPATAPRVRLRRPLEVVVIRFDSGNELVIHAMKARRQYLDLLD
jgi:hypothetical protein